MPNLCLYCVAPEFHHSCTQDAAALVQRHKLDYLVGSVHHVGGIPIDFSEEMYLRAAEKAGGLDHLFCNYFDQQYAQAAHAPLMSAAPGTRC